jgi:hypothetical protein
MGAATTGAPQLRQGWIDRRACTEELKEHGHILVRLLATAEASGLAVDMDAERRGHIGLLNEHRGVPLYEARYPQRGYKEWPDIRLVLAFAEPLREHLRPICVEASGYAEPRMG